MSKYSIANAALAQAQAQAQQEGVDVGETIEAIIITAMEASVKLRGPKVTRQSIMFELQNMAGDVDFDFVRSR